MPSEHYVLKKKFKKGVCPGAKPLAHAICFEDGDVNGYDPPEAQPCRQRVSVCGAYILPGL